MFLFLTLLILLVYLRFASTVYIANNDWNILKLFFSTAGCKSEFCNALSTNQTCLPSIVCDAIGNVVELQLNRYNLSGSLTTGVGQLRQLQSLVLSNNAFNSSIPSELAQLSQLTLLDLSNNQFVGTVPQEFDRSNVKTIVLHNNSLDGFVPFFPRATNCSIQIGGDSNKFCCSKGPSQLCCQANSCLCSCSGFAPVPNRCYLDDTGPNHALCVTTTTIGNQQTSDPWTPIPKYSVSNYFTVSFWAKAREALNDTLSVGLIRDPALSSSVFWAFGYNSDNDGLGFYLGTDGFTVTRHRYYRYTKACVVYRGTLLGWHHYSMVQTGQETRVYIDGNETASGDSAAGTDGSVSFDVCFGNARSFWPIVSTALGFEGWISELRIANRSLHGSEAFRQIDNRTVWSSSFSMRGCSGENHTDTSIESFGVQRSYLVCRSEPLPTCGTTANMFEEGELAGCLCELEDGSQQCIEWSANNSVIAHPLARWLFNENSTTVTDSSGNGFNGTWVGVPGSDYAVSDTLLNGSLFTSFKQFGYVKFNDSSQFNFGVRDFAIEVWIRTATGANIIVSKRLQADSSNAWVLYVDGEYNLKFDCHEDGYQNILTVSTTAHRDERWHFVSVRRTGGRFLSMFVDGILVNNTLSINAPNLTNSAPLLIGAEFSTPAYFYVGDLANLSVYVDTLPSSNPICSVNHLSPAIAAKYDCKRMLGFCSPKKSNQRPCCGIGGCAACETDYRVCSSYLLESKTMTTTTFTTSSDNQLTNSSLPLFVTSSSTMFESSLDLMKSGLPVFVTIIVAIVVGALCLSVGIAIVCFIQRNRLAKEIDEPSNDSQSSSTGNAQYAVLPPPNSTTNYSSPNNVPIPSSDAHYAEFLDANQLMEMNRAVVDTR